MVDKLFNPFTLLVGPVLVGIVVYKSTKPVADGGFHLPWWNVVLSYMVWLTATRTLKLLPHLWNRPQDIVYVPAFIAFGYYFAIMKLYALVTLHETGWGTRAGIGGTSEAVAAMDAREAEAKLAGGAAPSRGGTPGEKFGNNTSYPVPGAGAGGTAGYTLDDGRRYDPESVSYNSNSGSGGGFAR